jgi:hypothetical protein
LGISLFKEPFSADCLGSRGPKPIGTSAWRWADIAGYQDGIGLSSRIFEGGQWVAYQRGTLASIRPLLSLLEGFHKAAASEGSFMSCGTLSAIKNAAGQGIRRAPQIELTLFDPRAKRSIVHGYGFQILPMIA